MGAGPDDRAAEAVAGGVGALDASPRVRRQQRWHSFWLHRAMGAKLFLRGKGFAFMEITTDEAAERLGVSRRRVIEMLQAGDLVGRRVHRTWVVDLASVQDKIVSRGAGGRPLSPATVRAIIEMLSTGGAENMRKLRTAVMHRPSPELAASLAQAVEVRRFETRRPEIAAQHLHLTGESALESLTDGLGQDLVGQSGEVHGYRRTISLDDLIDEAMLVPNAAGMVAIYSFRDGRFPWDRTPRGLIAVDASRSRRARVRDSGLRALEQMRAGWQERTM